MAFQSTRPVWGATDGLLLSLCDERVSIHAPRVGRDWSSPTGSGSHLRFNPRAPCGARLLLARVVTESLKFQSTRPVWGATEFRIVGVVL